MPLHWILATIQTLKIRNLADAMNQNRMKMTFITPILTAVHLSPRRQIDCRQKSRQPLSSRTSQQTGGTSDFRHYP
jgi:hypothetical protein